MTVISRVARLFRADMHGLLDNIEEPELLLKQAVREMEAEQVLLKQQADGLQQQKTTVQATLQRTQKELSQLEEGLGLCLAEGNDDLARALLRKQLYLQRCHDEYQGRLVSLDHQLAETLERIEQQASALERIRQQAAVFDAGESGADSAVKADLGAITEADVEVALLKAKAQVKEQAKQQMKGHAS
ncbi:MAG: hypothetical protein D9N11_14630 [Ketobacter sp.]|nr:MAG: hypothetical protein D9N11_14630 [Ketobacter sp.]